MSRRSILSLVIGCISASFLTQAAEVNVYSARKEALIQPVLAQFTAATGVKVNLITGEADALLSRIESEAELSPADVIVTTDVGRLYWAKQRQLTQPLSSETLIQKVPANLRDSDHHWFALTVRARPIMYAKDRVSPEQLSTVEALTEAQWRGKVCVRSSGNIYNQSMIAAMLAQVGEVATLDFAKGLVANFARPPKGGDRDQIKAVAAGQCDIAIANTYYWAGIMQDANPSERQAAEKVAIFCPNQSDRGTHINISGAAIAKHAPNATAAQQLIEFMVTDAAQAWYAENNGEYPVVSTIASSDLLQQLGTFKAESIPLERVGELNQQAVMLMNKASWK